MSESKRQQSLLKLFDSWWDIWTNDRDVSKTTMYDVAASAYADAYLAGYDAAVKIVRGEQENVE